jgi:hypothetical protein
MGIGPETGEEAQAKRIENVENRRLSEFAARDALQRGAVEAGQARIAGSKMAGRQKVAYAASGVDPTVGTAAQVQAETAATSELEAATIENNAAREAWGFRRFGVKYQQQAALDSRRHGYRQAGTALSGLARLSKYADKG